MLTPADQLYTVDTNKLFSEIPSDIPTKNVGVETGPAPIKEASHLPPLVDPHLADRMFGIQESGPTPDMAAFEGTPEAPVPSSAEVPVSSPSEPVLSLFDHPSNSQDLATRQIGDMLSDNQASKKKSSLDGFDLKSFLETGVVETDSPIETRESAQTVYYFYYYRNQQGEEPELVYLSQGKTPKEAIALGVKKLSDEYQVDMDMIRHHIVFELWADTHAVSRVGKSSLKSMISLIR